MAASLALAGCVQNTTKYYQNTGTPNVTVSYNGKFEFPYVKTIWLDLTREDAACVSSELGTLRVENTNRVRVPTGNPLTIEVTYSSSSFLGPGGKSQTIPFRFIPEEGERYLFDIVDTGRSQGFEVYKSDDRGTKKNAVGYLSAHDCAK
jgi:hypothetical protein